MKKKKTTIICLNHFKFFSCSFENTGTAFIVMTPSLNYNIIISFVLESIVVNVTSYPEIDDSIIIV